MLAPLSSVSTLAALPLLSRIQLLDAVVSPINSCPMVRGVSRLTVVSALMFSLEKSAMPDAPVGTNPPAQLEARPHEPLPRKLQVPLVARATLTIAIAPLAATTAGISFRILFR